MKKVEMNIDDVAKLARLHLGVEEREKLSKQLSDILSYVQKLNELKIESIEPTQHILSVQNVMRADEVKPSLSPEKFLKNAPEARDGFFIVPQIIE